MSSALAICDNSQIHFVRWKDNSVVTVASTIGGISVTSTIRRWSRVRKQYEGIPVPDAIKKYNANMGGVDQMDQNINAYRISVRGKNNAWQLSNTKGDGLTQFEFRRAVARNYLEKHGVAPKSVDRFPSNPNMPLRYDEMRHLIAVIPNNKRLRCKNFGCSRIISTMCLRCNVRVCVQCFASYHTRS